MLVFSLSEVTGEGNVMELCSAVQFRENKNLKFLGKTKNRNQCQKQVAFKSQKLDPIVVVEKKTASTMDPTHPPQISTKFQ